MPPVGLFDRPGVGVERGDGGLSLKLAQPVSGEGCLENRDTLGNQVALPPAAVLLGKGDKPAVVAGRAGRASACLFTRAGRRWYRCCTPGTWSRKVWRQPRVRVHQTPHPHPHHHPAPVDRNIGHRPPVIAMHPTRSGPAPRADRGVPPRPGPHHDSFTLLGHVLDSQRR